MLEMIKFKKHLLILLFAFTICKIFSQDSKLSFEANLPVLMGQNFYADNYVGIFDIGGSYVFSNFNFTRLGISLNTSFLRDANIGRNNQFDLRLYILEPKLFATFTMPSNTNLHLKTSLGYSVFLFDLVQNENTIQFDFNENTTDAKSGIGLNLGLVYDFGERFYSNIQYEFVKLFTDNSTINNAYNTNVNILKIGVGIRI